MQHLYTISVPSTAVRRQSGPNKKKWQVTLLHVTPILRNENNLVTTKQRYEFYVYGSVHHNILSNNQQMQLYAVNFIPLLGPLYMFRAPYTPIIRSTLFNCIYSHWYIP